MNFFQGKLSKWFIIIAFSGVLAAAISNYEVNVTANSQVIYIEGGKPVLADRVDRTDQFVIYEADGKHGMFMQDDVTSVGSIQVNKKRSFVAVVDTNKRQIMTRLGISWHGIQEFDSRLLIFFVVLSGLSGIANLAPLIYKKVFRSVQKTKSAAPSPNHSESFGKEKEDTGTTSDERNIVLFFL